MRKSEKKLACSVMAVLLGGVMGVVTLTPASVMAGAFQIGTECIAFFDNTIAMGLYSHTYANNSIAIGAYNYTWGEQSVAMGMINATIGANSVAIGFQNYTDGYTSVAMGDSVYAGGYAATAFGYGNNTSNSGHSIADKSYGALGNYSFVGGYLSTAGGVGSVAMGYMAQTGAIWNNSGTVTVVGGEYAVAMGYNAKAYAEGSIAFGNSVAGAISGTNRGTSAVTVTGGTYAFAAGKSTASGNYSVAMGNGAEATPDNSFAFGGTVASGHTASVALGYGSKTGGEYEVSVGSGTDGDAYKTRKITNVTSAGILSSTNTNAATGADVYGATYIAGVHNYYDGSSTAVNVVSAVNALDTAMGKLSVDGNYILTSKNLYENVGLLDTKIGKIETDGTYAKQANTVSANLSALDTQVKSNADAITTLNGNSTTSGSVDYKIAQATNVLTTKVGTISQDKNYVTAAGTVSDNLMALDTQVKTNATNIETNTSNINILSDKVVDLESTGITAEKVIQIATNKSAIDTLNGDTSTSGSVANSIQTAFNSKVGTLDKDSYNIIHKEYNVSQNLEMLDKSVQGVMAESFFKADLNDNAYMKVQKKITNVAAGDISSATSTDVVTGGQLYTTNSNVTNNANAISEIQQYVTEDGLDANNKQITNVASAGELSSTNTNAVNAVDVYEATTMDIEGAYYAQGDSVTTAVKNIDAKVEALIGKGDDAAKAEGENSVAMGVKTKVTGDYSTAVGYNNTVSGNYSTAVGYKNTVTGSNSVALGAGSTATEDNVVSVGSDTVKRRVTNVAAGTSTYDAVNYGQYTELANSMERGFSKVNEDIGRTGAASAALASLHPQMMRKGESQVMAGMGRYHGKSGAAVGLAWQPHKRVMLSGGFADAAGEIMFNLGLSYKFGQRSYTAEQLADMYNGAGTPLYVAELNAALKSKDVQIMNLKADNAAIKAELAQLKAMVEQLVKEKC